MIQVVPKLKVEYGDFQTPLELAEKICYKLLELGVSPDIIIEPTCGTGNFVEASARSFQSASKIIGIEVNHDYLEQIGKNNQISQDGRIQVQQGNFFEFDWSSLIAQFTNKKILLLGNFPWVTNSQQGAIGGRNLPQKTNFQNHKGLDAIAGKSNFDISEWMLINSIQWLRDREAYLAMLCKTSVSRKLLNYIYSKELNLAYCATYKIDTKKYFAASVDACLLFCKFDSNVKKYFCDVFSSFDADNYYRIGYRNNTQIRDITSFDRLKDLHNPRMDAKWRSGIKHDCSNVMEFRKVDNMFVNGLGEVIDIEDTCLFPLVKGSDVAQNRTQSIERYVLVTQRYIGESTEYIQSIAPKTWNYLTNHSEYLDKRKSKVYKKNSRFSIFGVGSYTFAPWKIAICGLYKKLDFRLVGENNGKSTVFDDTVYFLSFEDEQAAQQTFKLLTSQTALDYYCSLIFWDEKRPIKSSILNSLNMTALAERLAINF
ncbi:class I SAM-dependent methyltransferase [Aliterella atlantica]|uniref:Modification methylase n=1 Tax=Aliterella atlantica CENA595 TaxID=1618023 RepID=A0A0D8ZPQ1_9CYAN|nr:class I SAM-dependent methyltransferase [Aliterella atlantica]KJH70783.1 modification methylase [Aliterella atlantica CENA595]